MNRKQLIMAVDIPAMETTKEGKLRGGFSTISNDGISLCGGPNNQCGRNDVCSDNNVCYDNKSSQLCAGNHATDCSSQYSTSTSTSSSSSTTSMSRMMADVFSLL